MHFRNSSSREGGVEVRGCLLQLSVGNDEGLGSTKRWWARTGQEAGVTGHDLDPLQGMRGRKEDLPTSLPQHWLSRHVPSQSQQEGPVCGSTTSAFLYLVSSTSQLAPSASAALDFCLAGFSLSFKNQLTCHLSRKLFLPPPQHPFTKAGLGGCVL